MAVKLGMTIPQFVKQINDDLAKKQDLLTTENAGNNISIDEVDGKVVISSNIRVPASYLKTFTAADFQDGHLTISAVDHKCGSEVALDYIKEKVGNNYSEVLVNFMTDADGNVTIEAEPFEGCLALQQHFSSTENLQALATDILEGTV